MTEDEIIAAYIRQEYPELLKTPAYAVFKAAYMLVVPVAKCFIDAFNKVFGGGTDV